MTGRQDTAILFTLTMAADAKVENNLSSYVRGLPPEARRRYLQKLCYNKGTENLPDPYKITKNDWINDPTMWPELDFDRPQESEIESIDTPSIYNKTSMKAYKSLEAYRYVESGHVDEVKIYDVKGSPFCFLKADVIGSMKVRDKPHQPWVCLEKETADIYCAHCTCLAGLGEVCSHIAAILFKVELGVRFGVTQRSVTSEECKWNKVFKKQIDVSPIMDIQHLMNSNRKNKVECVVSSSKDPLPDENVLKSFHQVCPNASFFSLIPPLFGDQSECTSKPSKLPKEEKFPRTLTSLYDENNKNLTANEIIVKSEQIFQSYKCSKSQIDNLFEATQSQNISTLWYEHRKGRITASKAHDVLTIRPTTSPDNLVMRIIGYKSYDLSKKEAIKWGLDNESVVRDAYIADAERNHTNFLCKLSGLKISESNHFLGASADGLVSCDCCGEGTIEIKCPHKYKDITILEAAQKDKTFCLDSQLQLRKNHKYYTQVQYQMYVNNTEYGDFIVMTCPKSEYHIVPIRIARDQEFIDFLINKCITFVKELIIPELLTRNLIDKPVVTDNISSTDNTSEKFCICNEPEYGKMIFCDGDSCAIGWFHYACVNVVRKPRGKWLCPRCKR